MSCIAPAGRGSAQQVPPRQRRPDEAASASSLRWPSGSARRTRRAVPRRSRRVRFVRARGRPSCVSSLTFQSWRFVRSQKSTASLGSKPGRAIVAGSKPRTHDFVRSARSAPWCGHHVIGMQAQEQRRKDRVVVDAIKVVAVDVADGRPLRFSVRRQAAAGMAQFGVSSEKRSRRQVVAPAVRRRELVELRMHQRQ